MDERTKSNRSEIEIALILGRFQPFHLGHLELIRAVSNRYEKIIIAIGSLYLNRRAGRAGFARAKVTTCNLQLN